MLYGMPASASPRSITAPFLSWILLIVYWCRSQVSGEILGLQASPLTDDKVSILILVYLCRCWNAVKPPPSSLSSFCHDLVIALASTGSLSSSGSPSKRASLSRKNTERKYQIERMIFWLEEQWKALEDLALVSPGALAMQIVRIMETAALCLNDEGANDEERRSDHSLDRMIDRRSPLGIPIRRMRLALEAMDEMASMPAIAREFVEWKQGLASETSSKLIKKGTGASPLDRLPSRMDVFTRLRRARHRGDYLATKDLIHQFFNYAPPPAHSQGGSRANLSAPSPANQGLQIRTRLHHQALLSLAGFQVEWAEWDLAEETLKEAIHLCRTERDNAALDVCQGLMKRITAAKKRLALIRLGNTAAQERLLGGVVSQWRLPSSSQGRNTAGPASYATVSSLTNADRTVRATNPVSNSEPESYTSDDLLDAIRCSRTGLYNLKSIIDELEKAIMSLPLPASARLGASAGSAAQQGSMGPKQPVLAPSGEPSRTFIAKRAPRPWATLAYLHARAGNVANARACRQLARSEPFPHASSAYAAEDELSMRMQEAWESAESGDYDAALNYLLNRDLIMSISLRGYRRWTWTVWRVLHLAMRRSGNTEGMSRIANLALGLDRMDENVEEYEDIEESSSFSSWIEDEDRASPAHLVDVQLRKLLSQADSLIAAGYGERAVLLVSKLLEVTQKLGRTNLYGQARLLLAQIQGFVLNHQVEALRTVEQMMPTYLADHNVEKKAEVCWTYARLILAAAKARAHTVSEGEAPTMAAASYTEEEVQLAIQWLKRARNYYLQASPRKTGTVEGRNLFVSEHCCCPGLVPVAYFLASLHDHIGQKEQGQLYCKEVDEAKRSQKDLASVHLQVERWQELIAQVGARITSPPLSQGLGD